MNLNPTQMTLGHSPISTLISSFPLDNDRNGRAEEKYCLLYLQASGDVR
jgi:hypothetical protein